MNYSRPFLSRELDQWLPLAKQAIATLCPDDSLLQFNRTDQKWYPVSPASIVGSPYDFVAPLEVVNGNDVQIAPIDLGQFYTQGASEFVPTQLLPMVPYTGLGIIDMATTYTGTETPASPATIEVGIIPGVYGQHLVTVQDSLTLEAAAAWVLPEELLIGDGSTIDITVDPNQLPIGPNGSDVYRLKAAVKPGLVGEVLYTVDDGSGNPVTSWELPVLPTIEAFELLIAQTSILRITAEMDTSSGTPGDLIDFTSVITGATTDIISTALGFGALIPGLTIGINVLVPSGGSPTGPILSVVDDLGNVFATIDLSVLIVAEKDAVPGTTFKMLGLGRKLSLRLDTLAVDYAPYTVVVNALASFTPT